MLVKELVNTIRIKYLQLKYNQRHLLITVLLVQSN